MRNICSKNWRIASLSLSHTRPKTDVYEHAELEKSVGKWLQQRPTTGRKCRTCQWNFDAICSSFRGASIFGFGGHINRLLMSLKTSADASPSLQRNHLKLSIFSSAFQLQYSAVMRSPSWARLMMTISHFNHTITVYLIFQPAGFVSAGSKNNNNNSNNNDIGLIIITIIII